MCDLVINLWSWIAAMNWHSVIPPLFGAFFGALGAYLIGRFKEKRDEDNRRHTALLATQYALFSQWNVIEDIRKNLLEPSRKDPERYFKMLQYFRVVGELNVPFEELTFIDSKDPNLLQEIHIAEKRFTSSTDLLNKLNEKRLEIQDKYHPKNFDMKTGRRSEMIVPAFEVFRLKVLTDLLYDEVDKTLPDLTKTNERLFSFIKTNLKGRKAAAFVPEAQAAKFQA
jgi:hypothetical protein